MQSWMDLCYRASKAGIPLDLLLRAAEDLKEVSDRGPAFYADGDGDIWVGESDGSVTLMWGSDSRPLPDEEITSIPLQEAEELFGLIPLYRNIDPLEVESLRLSPCDVSVFYYM